MRALGRTDKLALITCLRRLNVPGAFLNLDCIVVSPSQNKFGAAFFCVFFFSGLHLPARRSFLFHTSSWYDFCAALGVHILMQVSGTLIVGHHCADYCADYFR